MKQGYSAIRFSLLLGLIMILAACGSTPAKTIATTTAPVVASTSPAVSADASASPAVSAVASAVTSDVPKKSNSVSIKGFKFDPETIEINKGETVIWKNEDSASHTVTFDAFHSDSMNQGDTYEHTFDTVGTFSYRCGNHPAMTGTVKVK